MKEKTQRRSVTQGSHVSPFLEHMNFPAQLFFLFYEVFGGEYGPDLERGKWAHYCA